MSCTPGLCISAKLDLVTGVHQSGDRFMLALYAPAANLNPYVEEYTKQDEVKGKGYQAGGMVLQGYTPTVEGIHAGVVWDKETIWKNATITARSGLIYNASKGNKALMVIDIMDETGNPVTSTNGNFKVDGGIAFFVG